MAKTELRALRRFPRMEGDSVRPMQPGETFTVDQKEAAALIAAGKAERVETKPAAPVKKGT
jgi:hypothetical protein